MDKRIRVTGAMVLTALSCLSGVSAYGQERGGNASPYAFSGPCASQGSWTRAALSHTNEVKQVITKLKDNPACNSLKASLEASLTGLSAAVNEIETMEKSADARTRRLSQLPQEIAALRIFSRENSAFRGNVIQALMGKTISVSALSSQKSNGMHLDPNGVAASIGDLGARVKVATHSGLQLFNSTMTAMQQAQAECLDDTQGVAFAAGMVKILSSFASSANNGLNTQLATAVQNVGQYLSREKKYVNALRKLNDREFISSMSCLIEITSDGFCSVLDAQYLFREVMESQSVKLQKETNKRTGQVETKVVGLNENFAKKLAQGPLAGYYILSRQVPIVTNWIQKVQYGITPQLPTEAEFQAGVSTNTYHHFNIQKKIEGTFNYQKKLLEELTDFKSKQTYVLQMLNNVAGNMLGGGMRDGENFFSKVSSANEIYFRLLGMSTLPDAVLGTGPEGMQFANNAEGWLQAKYRTLPLFNDPDKLAGIISENMQILFREASNMAVAYYNKYFIVDKVQVMNDSLLGLDSNVRDALVNIDRYLENLKKRMTEDGKDLTMVASIVDTRARIGRILERYRQVRQYSERLVAQDDPDLNKNLRKLVENLLQQVYSELEVLTARTGFLSNRMATFVAADYTISLRQRNQMDPYFEDLMLATGYGALTSMVDMSQNGYSKVKTDLDQAMNIYKKNIDALEEVVSGGLMRNIFDLKLSAMETVLTESQRTQIIYEFERKMSSAKLPGEDSNVVQRFIRGVLNRIWTDLSGKDSEELGAPSFLDKLALPFKDLGNKLLGRQGKIISTPTSEFNTAEGEMAKLCTQTLAFANLRPYWELCKDVQLDSPMMKKNVTDPELKKLMDTYLSVNYLQKAYENIETDKKNITGKDRARNYQARICALRDYHRRNEIARLTSGMINDGQNYESPFAASLEVPANGH